MAISRCRPAVVAAVVLLSTIYAARAQVQCSGVVNAASYEPGLPEAGALALVFCTGVPAVSGVVMAPTLLPIPEQLSGVSILINDYYPAPILAVADLGGFYQINFQVPMERLLAQKSSLQVVTQQASGTVQSSQKIEDLDYPTTGGFFADAQGIAIAQHVSDASLVTSQNPARPGEPIAILGTGFGATYPPKPIGFPAPAQPAFQGTMNFADPGEQFDISLPLRQLTVGTSVAKVTFVGLAPGFAGVDQIVFQVPADAISGPLNLNVAVGSTLCSPFPSAQRCPFTASGTTNTVKLPVR
jgi:adhesin/invasin